MSDPTPDAPCRPIGAPFDHAPAWLQEALAAFQRNVEDPAYPCLYGTQALRAGALHFGAVATGADARLPGILQHFLQFCRVHPLANLAVFFEPTPETSYDAAHDWFWKVLRRLQADDRAPSAPADTPDDPFWEFSFAGQPMFVVGVSPAYRRRRSRNLGPCPILLFQPRTVFDVLETRSGVASHARATIRERLLAWDGVPHHVDLGVYGDPQNREWKQYFLPDHDRPVAGVCPLHADSQLEALEQAATTMGNA